MTKTGKIIYGVGKLIGNTTEYSIELTGKVVASIAGASGNEKIAVNSKKYSQIVAKALGKTVKVTAAVTAVVADKTIDMTISTVKYIAENAVETSVKVYGQSEEFYDEDKYIEVDYKVEDK